MSGKGIATKDEALLVAYVDGDLSLVEAAEFEQRLATEPELASTLHRFLAADEFGQQLVSKLRANRLRPWPFGLLLGVAALAAAAAALICVLWLPEEKTASFKLTEIAQVGARGSVDPEVAFRVKVTCARECYMLLMTISTAGSAAAVVQRHPLKDGPFPLRISNWPKEPFLAGSEFVLPPSSNYPFNLPDTGLVLVCTRTDGPFGAKDIEQVRQGVEATVNGLIGPIIATHPNATRLAAKVATLVRGVSREGWQVECVAVGEN